jgi:CBS domain containing-hemolysin-like protein
MSWLVAGLILYVLMVMAERAIVAVTPHELDVLRAEGTPSARRVIAVAGNQSRRSLAALSLGRVLVVVWMSIAGARLLLHAIYKWYQTAYQEGIQPAPGLVVLFAIFLPVTALFAFLLLKISQIDLRKSKREIVVFWLQRLSRLVRIFQVLFRPFLPEQEPERIAANTPHQKKTKEQEPGKRRDIEILKSIAKFGDVTIRQVMQPQPNITAIENNTNFRKVLQIIRQSGFSRLPVFEDTIDNVIGTLYVKDILRFTDQPADFNWLQFVRTDTIIVPETKPISELLQDFKKRKRHMAVVVDEFGGTSGLVTMEDILEEVIGEIRDEFDEDNEIPPYKQLDMNTFLFSGATMINDVCQIAGLDPETFEEVRGDADTIAGLVLTLIGDIPQAGDQTQWGSYLFTVERANNRRIDQIRLQV